MARPIAAPDGLRLDPNAFVAVDVETANGDAGSICQIGFARFAEGQLVENWSWLVHPQTYFSAGNIAIHGIRPGDVTHAPDWAAIHDRVADVMAGQIVVSHTAFDVTAITRACLAHGCPVIDAQWLDSVRVARRAFPELKTRGGHGLASLKRHLKLDFAHHDAGEDARAAGQVVAAAVRATGLSVTDWLTEAHRPAQAVIAEYEAARQLI
ncbi:exonuclease domain-containing protein [Salinisphaera hydrothermalis]|uniref:Type III DNA polymerase PolC n=1 Tax=Salinisphaera hydrothermalis (strain C41B8) TaxID=1304275 RepID=A0A084IPJ0_SALHC|nr:exonuclease domain-containing protein [Salinisphaera hydrothermalis]KEZ78624.1 type III DNA polymerase PolC [Salinisphaera hydrothermalis C41B8]